VKDANVHGARAAHASSIVESVRAEATRSPRFSVRFARGEAELVLGEPLALGGQSEGKAAHGVVRSLVMSAGPAPRITDFTRGWRALANRRTTLIRAELALDPSRLGIVSSREASARGSSGAGWWLAGLVPGPEGDLHADGRLLLERERPWGHVALELGPATDGPDLLLVPLAARTFHAGPGVPIAELEDVVRSMVHASAPHLEGAPHLDGARGAIDFSDLFQRALTDALVPHGLRVPELRGLRRTVTLSGGQLLLTASREDQPPLPLVEGRRETGRRLAPALVRAIAGALPSELATLVDPRLPSELRQAFGLLEASPSQGTSSQGGGLPAELVRLRDMLAEAAPVSPAELAAQAQRIDAKERAPGVATDALLTTARHLGADLPRARELLARAFSRSPSRPDVLAASLELAGASDPLISKEVLREVERGQRERGQRVDPWLDVALARAEEQLGEQDAAFERWERASRSPLTLPETFEGLAKQLVRRGRLPDALAAFERAAELYLKTERVEASARARLAAARIALAGREPLAALARLETLRSVLGAEVDLSLSAELFTLEARIFRAMGEPARAERAELALAHLCDRAGLDAPDEAVSALLDAARSLLSAEEGPSSPTDRGGLVDRGARADALLEVVARVRPSDPRCEELRRTELAGLLARVEAASERSSVARPIADALRARGRPTDAAQILARAGELDRDLTLLRVALDLVEKSGDRALFLSLLDRTLAVVGEGPARAALEARR
jgi:tetratricopeptide (TPR) repeat protein